MCVTPLLSNYNTFGAALVLIVVLDSSHNSVASCRHDHIITSSRASFEPNDQYDQYYILHETGASGHTRLSSSVCMCLHVPVTEWNNSLIWQNPEGPNVIRQNKSICRMDVRPN